MREAYLKFIQDYCNNADLIDSDIIAIVIDRMIEFDGNTNGVKSESLGDYSVTYETDYPPNLLRLLKPYKRVKFV